MSKIILVTHQKGGVGKSTLAFNLAQNISVSTRVAVVDLDVQGSLSQISDLVTDFDILSFTGNVNEIINLDYDFILIDTPPYLSNHLNDLIQMADLIIVPTKAGVLDLLAIESTITLIAKGNKKDNTLIVFNMIKANTTLTLDIMIGLEEYKVKVAKTHISDLVSFTRSVLLKGVERDKKAQKQIDSLTKEILTKLI